MRDPDRIDPLLDLLERAWVNDPGLRLGQLVANAASMGGWTSRTDVFNVEDEVLERGLRRMLEENERHLAVTEREHE